MPLQCRSIVEIGFSLRNCDIIAKATMPSLQAHFYCVKPRMELLIAKQCLNTGIRQRIQHMKVPKSL